MAELTASTGQKDPGGIYSYLQGAAALYGTGLNVFNQVTGKTQAPNAGPQVSTTPVVPATKGEMTTASWKKYLPWILGGAALLAVVYFISKK